MRKKDLRIVKTDLFFFYRKKRIKKVSRFTSFRNQAQRLNTNIKEAKTGKTHNFDLTMINHQPFFRHKKPPIVEPPAANLK
jgi:glutathione synthase/RimK-type ligase-like ATP-grasp enzyme